MADIVPVIEKLIQLAVKNPERIEAAAAALKAVELIDKFSIPIGSNVTIVRDIKEWKPESPDFMRTVDDILRGRGVVNPDVNPAQATSNYVPGGLAIQSQELVDPHEAWRQRMVDAWRAIREERAKLSAWVDRWERHYRKKWEHSEDGQTIGR